MTRLLSRHWRLLREQGAAAPAFPLLVLFAVYFFDEFDTAAFGVLSPSIKRAFGLTDQEFGLVVAANLVIVLASAVPLGYYGDRLPRRTLVVVGATLAGVFSFATGLAPTVAVLLLARIGNGIGVLVNDPIHRSLLSDYYRADQRPTVYATHANAARWGAVVGAALAGGVASAAGWRAAFLILLLPILAMAAVATRLPPVLRGHTDDDDAAQAAATEPPVPFKAAVRLLRGVDTLRRQYLAWVFIGAGLVPIAFYFPLYLDKVFHLSPAAIGALVAVGNLLALAAVQISGRLTVGWLQRDLGYPLRAAGVAVVGVAPGLLVMAVAPDLPIAIAGLMWAFFVAGFFTPPFFSVLALVSPARVRSLSFALSALSLVGGFVAFLVVFGSVADHSIRQGIALLAPWWVIGGLVLASAQRFVAPDAARALATLRAAALQHATDQTDGTSALRASGMDVSYGQLQVLFDAGLTVRHGEVVALLGTNGAGKSTLLKSLSGLLPAQRGRVELDGTEMTFTDPVQRVRAGLIMAPGGHGVFPSLTVAENLRLAEWTVRGDAGWLAEARARVLELFPALADRMGTRAGALSGGEQQMLTLAQALVCRPRVLMIDELSLGLAPVIVAQLLDAVRAMVAQGITVVVVEQSVNVATSIASRAVFMERGEVRFDGPTSELVQRPDLLRSVFLGAPAKATPGTKRPVAHDRAPVLTVTGAACAFGGVTALQGVDLTVGAGEVVGVIGANGAGKTTFLDVCSGFLTPDAGQVLLAGQDVTRWSAARRADLGLGRVFQDARLFPSLTVTETLGLAHERHFEVKDPLACIVGLGAAVRSQTEIDRHVEVLLEQFGLGRYRDALIADLSTGTRRVVELACAFAHQPAVLLLDEPSSGIAQREVEALAEVLLRLRVDTGAAFLIVEHDVPLVSSLSDRLVCLDQGAVLSTGTPKQVLSDPRVIAAYLGSDQATISRSGARR